MTRNEEIKQEAYRRYCNDPSVIFNIQCLCFKSGAKWADKTRIERACEWLKKNLQNYIENDWMSQPDFIEEFKKAMTE